MKHLLLLLLPFALLAKEHFAKVEPYEEALLKAAVSGLVVKAKWQQEGTVAHGVRIVHIDDALEKEELNATQKSIALFEEMVTINQQIESSLAQSVKRQRGYFERLSKLSTASKTQKDNAYNAYASSKTQYLSIKEKIASLKKQLLDLSYKAKRLEDVIGKKSIVVQGRFVESVKVRAGEFVAPGTPLAKVADLSRAKLVLFLSPSERKDAKTKRIYIDGKPTNYQIDKVWQTVDEKFISSYRAEIYLPAKALTFGTLVKVELK